ncbi:alpha/beta fold hydrolase [Mycolicibacterium phlei]|jgi:pimeloyl-ACP methyl ester carboxylesterase
MAASIAARRDGCLRLACGSVTYTVAGRGPALMLIHGLGGSRHTWDRFIDALSDSYTVIAPDLPGHGDSDAPPGDYSLGAYASVLRDLALALGHRRFTAVGHSLGGGIALQTAYQFPERVDRLILISSGGLGPEVSYALRAATLPGAEAVLSALCAVPATLLKRVLAIAPTTVTGADAHAVCEVLAALRAKKQRRAFIRTARSVIDWRGQAVSATRHACLLKGVPLFLAWGSADATIPPDHHRSFAARVAEAVTVELPGAGHFPHETHSAVLLSSLRRFLANTTPFEYSESSWVARLKMPPSPMPASA